MLPAMKAAVSYLRVSGKGQVSGDGFPRQRAAIAQFAKQHRISMLEEFTDEDVSGTKELEARTGLAALLDRLESNDVDAVLIENASRIARDLLISEVIIGQLRDRGVRVVAADSGQDLTADGDDPTRTLIRQVLGAVAEFEKTVLVSRLRAARDRVRLRSGRCEGPVPFGERPSEAPAVEMIRELRRKPRGQPRLGYQRIAKILNERGVLSRSGKPWSRSSIQLVVERLEGKR